MGNVVRVDRNNSGKRAAQAIENYALVVHIRDMTEDHEEQSSPRQADPEVFSVLTVHSVAVSFEIMEPAAAAPSKVDTSSENASLLRKLERLQATVGEAIHELTVADPLATSSSRQRAALAWFAGLGDAFKKPVEEC